jgi:hypothetical protein
MLQKNIKVSHGELLDKLSILVIKSEKIKDEEKLRNVNYELGILEEATGSWSDWHDSTCSLYQDLLLTNRRLWETEDKIRILDTAIFPIMFLDTINQGALENYLFLARSVYILNDKRAELKKQINILNKSAIVEEKSYYEQQKKS